MSDKRDIHQAKSRGRHKTQAGSRRGAAIVTGPDTTGTGVGLDRPAKPDSAPPASGRARKHNGR